MKYTVIASDTEEKVAVVDHLESHDGTLWEVSVVGADGKETKCNLSGAVVRVENDRLEVLFAGDQSGRRMTFPALIQQGDASFLVATALGNLRLSASRGAASGAAAEFKAAHKSIKSSMPGKVIKILCKPGDQIEVGQPLLIIEAMKMENEIVATQAGIVGSVPVQEGQSIQTGELLVVMEAKK